MSQSQPNSARIRTRFALQRLANVQFVTLARFSPLYADQAILPAMSIAVHLYPLVRSQMLKKGDPQNSGLFP
jgi:hypothetical protein